jgi:hypothetical protein
MAQTYPLDQVVRLVNERFDDLKDEQTIVVIDTETKKTFKTIDNKGTHKHERRGIRSWHKPKTHVLVSNNRDSRNEAVGTVRNIPLRDFISELRLDMQLTYLASCELGNEIKVAEALHDGQHPGLVLQDLLVRWVKEYEKANNHDLLTKFYSRQRKLEGYLARRTEEEIGLNVLISTSLEDEEAALKLLEIAPTNILVRVKDYPEKQNVRLQAEIGVDEEQKIFAVLHRNRMADIELIVKDYVRSFFAANVSLHIFDTRLQHIDIQRPLKDGLDAKLKEFGRRVEFLTVETTSNGHEAKLFKEYKYDVPYSIQNKEKVVIKNAVQMSLEDSALFKIASVPDLEGWVVSQLTEIVPQVLFDKQYIDLLIGFDSSRKAIRKAFIERAEAIGYSVKQLVTGPDLEPYQWLKNFTIKIDESFDVKSSRLPVKLSIVITARINDLRDVKNYLNHQQRVPEEMKAAVLAEARQFLHTVDPERFYLRFTYTDRKDEIPVEEALDNQIRNRLTTDFKADIVSVTIDMGETEITLLHDQLRRTPGEFRVEIKSFVSSEPYQVVYTGSFRIEGVHYEHWDKFQSRNPTIEAIRTTLEQHLISEMRVLRRELLGYQTRAQQRQIVAVIDHLARQQILSEFGLSIAISMVSRETTGDEAQKQKETRRIYELAHAHSQTRVAEMMGTISSLKSKRLELIVGDADSQEIKDTESKIDSLQSEIPLTASLTSERFEVLELPASVRQTELAEFFDSAPQPVLALTEGAKANGHEESE